MKLLRVSNGQGEYLDSAGNYLLIDKIGKDDLLRLASCTLDHESVELDEYDESAIKNRAHQAIYRSVFNKLRELRGRRQQFKDAAARLYLDEYERYASTVGK